MRGSLKAGVFACAFAWLSSTVKSEYIGEAARSFDVRRRHHERRGTVALIPKHMVLRGEGLYRGGNSSSTAVDHGYIWGARNSLII